MKSISHIISALLFVSLATAAFAQKGTITFFNKKIDYQKATASGSVSEYELGDPLYISAVFDKGLKEACSDCKQMNIRYSSGDVTYTSTQMRSDYSDMYTVAAGPGYYASDNEAGMQLISGKGWYFEGYDLTEDAFRLFLNKINSKLTPGATIPVKVELLVAKDPKDEGKTVLATGTFNIKATAKLKEHNNFLTRINPMLTDAGAEKAIADQFKIKVTSTSKILKVALVGNFNYKRNELTSVNENKNVDAVVAYKNTKNECWVAKFNYFFEAEGADFSKLAKMGKAGFIAPVPCNCFE